MQDAQRPEPDDDAREGASEPTREPPPNLSVATPTTPSVADEVVDAVSQSVCCLAEAATLPDLGGAGCCLAEAVLAPGCFVATASLGEGHPDLDTLRALRDRVLAHSAAGRAFIRFYYRFGPYAARLVVRSRTLRFVVREGLVRPAARAARLVLAHTPR